MTDFDKFMSWLLTFAAECAFLGIGWVMLVMAIGGSAHR